jgi:hypothetical protein
VSDARQANTTPISAPQTSAKVNADFAFAETKRTLRPAMTSADKIAPARPAPMAEGKAELPARTMVVCRPSGLHKRTETQSGMMTIHHRPPRRTRRIGLWT